MHELDDGCAADYDAPAVGRVGHDALWLATKEEDEKKRRDEPKLTDEEAPKMQEDLKRMQLKQENAIKQVLGDDA